MEYPFLSELNTTRELIDVFRGYNHNLRIGDGEFYEMKNMSSNDYPILSPRPVRGVYASPALPQGMIAKDDFCYIDGGDFVMNEKRYSLGLTVERDGDGKIIPKTLISMGAYVIILPDKKYINTADPENDNGPIEATVTTSGTVSFSICQLDGGEYKGMTIGDTAPENPTNMAVWLDLSGYPQLKQYSASTGMWVSIATTYIKIEAAGIGVPFKVGDGVTISGVDEGLVTDLNNTMVIQARGDGYIVVTGIIQGVHTQERPICVSRWMPDFDYVIESENRLWGCKYGFAYKGKAYDAEKGETIDQYSTEPVNELYACKLGDFKNWNCFMGISTDSYAVTVGTDGQFTGAIAYLGYPLFFKENCMHKVYGNYPATYQVLTTSCRGVQKGCGRSTAIVNETLYYKSRTGVCAYDGSLPIEISSALGDVSYDSAVAGSVGNKYYISMKDTEGCYHLFVYDTLKGMWHREDDTEAEQFCSYKGDLYFIDRAHDQIKTVRGTGTKEVGKIKWEAVTGIIGTDSPDKKYISKLDVRMALTHGARVLFFIQYDSTSEWEQLFTMVGTNLKSFSVPIKPKRCDHLRLKILGEGDAKIYSICKTIEWGSDK